MSMALIVALAAPAAAASPNGGTSDDASAPVSKVLSRVVAFDGPDLSPMTAGRWRAGCRMDGHLHGIRVWSYTVWQEYSSNGSVINRPVSPPAYSAQAWAGWSFEGPYTTPSQWWVTRYTRLAAQGQYSFRLVINGISINSASGFVRIDVNANGTWTCSGA
jgi:hypothetical protein